MRPVGPTHDQPLKEAINLKFAKQDTYVIEDVGGAEVRRQVKAGDPIHPHLVPEDESQVEERVPGPAPGIAGDPVTTEVVLEPPYDDHGVDDLRAEAERRGLEVEGTGANGNVVKDDLVAALAASDES